MRDIVTGDFTGNGETGLGGDRWGLGGIGTYLSNGDGTFHAVFSPQTGTDWVDWRNATFVTGDFIGK